MLSCAVKFQGPQEQFHIFTVPQDLSLAQFRERVASKFAQRNVTLKHPTSFAEFRTDGDLHQYWKVYKSNPVRAFPAPPPLFGPISRSLFAKTGVLVDESASQVEDLLMTSTNPDSGSMVDLYHKVLEGSKPQFEAITQKLGTRSQAFRGLVSEMADARATWMTRPSRPIEETTIASPFSFRPATQPQRERQPKLSRMDAHHAFCDECRRPIRGIRYKCLHCKDYDLCAFCEASGGNHHPTHVFAKLRNTSHLPLPSTGSSGHETDYCKPIPTIPLAASESSRQRTALSNRVLQLEDAVQELQVQLQYLELHS